MWKPRLGARGGRAGATERQAQAVGGAATHWGAGPQVTCCDGNRRLTQHLGQWPCGGPLSALPSREHLSGRRRCPGPWPLAEVLAGCCSDSLWVSRAPSAQRVQTRQRLDLRPGVGTLHRKVGASGSAQPVWGAVWAVFSSKLRWGRVLCDLESASSEHKASKCWGLEQRASRGTGPGSALSSHPEERRACARVFGRGCGPSESRPRSLK